MGTNYYFTRNPITGAEWEEEIEDTNPLRHIGKRSAAGAYCYTCGTTLCKYGTTCVHQYGFRWHKECPICGQAGVPSCSFTITLLSHKALLQKLSRNKTRGKEDQKWVVDEYGQTFTAVEMLKIIKECPIIFQDCSEFE